MREVVGMSDSEGQTMAKHPNSPSRRLSKWAASLLLVASACAMPSPPTAAQSPVPTGQARIWFYRDWQPSESLNLANIDVNGIYFASVANGGAIYRDVPPGHYHLTPNSFVPNVNQDATIELVAGEQAFAKIVSLTSWGDDNTGSKNISRDAFWVWVIPPAVAESEIAGIRN
jgi:Protein of unknown function (DUF2846)